MHADSPSPTSEGLTPTQDHTMCLRCGYVLRGLTEISLCPECGVSVQNSTAKLRQLDPLWLGKLGQGFVLISVACVIWAVVLLIPLPAAIAGTFMGVNRIYLALQLAALLGIPYFVMGVWSLTSNELSPTKLQSGDGRAPKARILLRILVTLMPLAILLELRDIRGWRGTMESLPILVPVYAVPALAVVSLLYYFAWISDLAQSRSTALWTRRIAPGIGLFLFLIELIPWDEWLYDHLPSAYWVSVHRDIVLFVVDGVVALTILERGLATYRALLRGRVNADPYCRFCFCSLRDGMVNQQCPGCGRSFSLAESSSVLTSVNERTLIRWLTHDGLARMASPPRRLARHWPWLTLALSIPATVLPSVHQDFLPSFALLARWMWYLGTGGLLLCLLAGWVIRRRCGSGPLARQLTPTLFDHRRRIYRASLALGIAILLLMTSLPQRLFLHLHRTALDRYAQQIDSTPFVNGMSAPRWVGMYFLIGTDRCPHGLTFYVPGGGELFYRTDPGECSRHQIGRQIEGNWYEMEY